MHGKIWALIFLSPEPIDANFIKGTLEISKALTSMSLKDLLFYNVIEEVEKDKPGTQKYTINYDITTVIMDVLKKREMKMLEEIQSSCQGLKKVVDKRPDQGVDKKRMDDLTLMVSSAHLLLQGMMQGSQVDFNQFEQAMTLASPKE